MLYHFQTACILPIPARSHKYSVPMPSPAPQIRCQSPQRSIYIYTHPRFRKFHVTLHYAVQILGNCGQSV